MQSLNYSWALSEQARNVFKLSDNTLLDIEDRLSSSDLFDSTSAKNKFRFEDIHLLLQKHLSRTPLLDALNVFNEDGVLLYSSIEPLPVVKIADRSYFQKLKAHPKLGRVFSDPIISRTTKKPTVIVAIPILSKEGKFIGTVQAYVGLDRFISFYQTLDLGRHGVIWMTAKVGLQNMVRYPADLRGTKPATHSQNSPLKVYYENEIPQGTLLIKSPEDKLTRKVSFHRIQDYPFYVEVGLAKVDYEASWKIRIIFFSLTLLVNIGIAFLFVRRLAKSKINEDKANNKSKHDSLTGLPNRRFLLESIINDIYRAKRDNDKLAILFLDLDGFKQVNDKFGHETGDLLLKEVAKRLKRIVRDGDTVARIGGDEFTVVLNNFSDDGNVNLVAQKIITVLSTPFVLKEQQCQVGVSIGIAFYPADSTDYENLLNQADMAMYQAKQSGKNTYRFYRDMNNDVV